MFVQLCNERYHGYRFGDVFVARLAWLDQQRGLFPWHNLFNLVVLRMISFNLDYHWLRADRLLTDRHTLKTNALAEAIARLTGDEQRALDEAARLLDRLAEQL